MQEESFGARGLWITRGMEGVDDARKTVPHNSV
jgi:hypothetical protein